MYFDIQQNALYAINGRYNNTSLRTPPKIYKYSYIDEKKYANELF